MTLEQAAQTWTIVGQYLAVGVVFGLIFVTFVVGRLDPNAKGMKIGVRLLILPAVALLWPVMLYKTIFWKRPPIR